MDVHLAPARGAGVRDRPARARGRRARLVAGVAVVIGLVVAFALLRNPGQAPFGSDHDEYRMVAASLLAGDGPVVAGVEGTKYPLGYPLVLTLTSLLGLPVTAAAIVVNVLLAGLVVVVVSHLTSNLGSRPAQLAAAVFVAANVALWAAAYAVMPDVLITALSAVLLWRMQRLTGIGDVLVVSLLGVAATSVKSVGLLLAGAASLALLVRPGPLRRWCWVPGATALAAAAAHAWWVAPYADHTTGYRTVFWLTDPYDVASQRASLPQVAARLVTRVPDVLQDVGDAVAGPHVADGVALVVAVALLALGVWSFRQNRAFAVALVAVYGAGLTLWPFESVRFGLPLLPLAAVGVAGAVARLQSLTPPWPVVGSGAVAAVLAVTVVAGGVRARGEAVSDGATYGRLADGTAELAAWAAAEVPSTDVLASLDYREIAYRLDRPVLPLPYSTDDAELLRRMRAGDASWFVAYRDVYRRRSAVTRQLVRAQRDGLELAYRNDAVSVWRVIPEGAP